MKPADVLDLALGNLRLARLRTALTTAGVAIGVGALVGMVSFGFGLQENLNARILKNAFFQTVTLFPKQERGSSEPARPVDEVALAAIRQIPGVERANLDVRLPLRLQAGGKTASGMAVGLARQAGDEGVFKEIPHGTFFSAEDAPEVILGSDLAKELGFADPRSAIGQTVRATIGGNAPPAGLAALPQVAFEAKVVGVVTRERTAIGGGFGSRIYLPYGYALAQQTKFLEAFPVAAAFRNVTSATVYVESARDLDRVEKAVEGMGFRTMSVATAIAQLRRAFLVMDAILGLVGSIGVAVACLGITNTMVMSVLERTREIGIMKAVGAEDRDVRRVFLAESAAIGAAGGACGLVLAWVLGRVINHGANLWFARQGFPPETLFTIPWWLVLGALVFAVVVAVGSGLYPAARAARVDPTRALRHE